MALEDTNLIARVERFLAAAGRKRCKVPFEALRIAAGVQNIDDEAAVIAAADYLKDKKGWNYEVLWLEMEIEFIEP